MELTVNESQQQFELELENGGVAFVEFVVKDDKIYLTHTEVPKSMQGRGIASQLVEKTLAHIQAQQRKLVPLCSFVSRYVDEHEQWHSLLADGYQM